MAPAAGTTQDAADREAVLKIVQAFFDSMTARDVEGARKILVPRGLFYGMDMRKPNADPVSFSVEEYFERLLQSKSTNRERIWNPDVRVRGSIATVWAPYDFWADSKYSHCGVDSFDLIRTGEGWKITGAVFTMEARCEPNPLGPPKQ